MYFLMVVSQSCIILCPLGDFSEASESGLSESIDATQAVPDATKAEQAENFDERSKDLAYVTKRTAQKDWQAVENKAMGARHTQEFNNLNKKDQNFNSQVLELSKRHAAETAELQRQHAILNQILEQNRNKAAKEWSWQRLKKIVWDSWSLRDIWSKWFDKKSAVAIEHAQKPTGTANVMVSLDEQANALVSTALHSVFGMDLSSENIFESDLKRILLEYPNWRTNVQKNVDDLIDQAYAKGSLENNALRSKVAKTLADFGLPLKQDEINEVAEQLIAEAGKFQAGQDVKEQLKNATLSDRNLFQIYAQKFAEQRYSVKNAAKITQAINRILQNRMPAEILYQK